MKSPVDLSSPQSEYPRSQASPAGRIKHNFRASLKSAFRISPPHSSESSPVKSSLGRPSPSQGPEAFNVFHTPRAGSSSKVIDVNAALIAQYLPSSRVGASVSPVDVPRRAVSNVLLLPPASSRKHLSDTQTPTPVAATEALAAVDNKRSMTKPIASHQSPTAPPAQQPPKLPIFKPLVLVATPPFRAAAVSVDTAMSGSERGVRRTSLSREHAQLVTRMTTLRQERDRAVTDADACRAQVQSLLEKMKALAPMVTLLEECKTVGTAMHI